MDDKLMRLMSQFALVGLVIIVLSKATTKKATTAAPVPTNAAGPSLVYDSWVVAPGR